MSRLCTGEKREMTLYTKISSTLCYETMLTMQLPEVASLSQYQSSRILQNVVYLNSYVCINYVPFPQPTQDSQNITTTNQEMYHVKNNHAVHSLKCLSNVTLNCCYTTIGSYWQNHFRRFIQQIVLLASFINGCTLALGAMLNFQKNPN